MEAGLFSLARIHEQVVPVLPHEFPANTQTLQPEEPAGGSEVNVTDTELTVVLYGPGKPLNNIPDGPDQL